MAQVTEFPPTTKDHASGAIDTDELLSQLAGSEIDRLLAEADGKSPAPAVPAPAGPDPAVTEQLDNLFKEMEKSPAAPPPQSPPPPAPAEPIPSPPSADTAPEGAERSALLEAAGFDPPPGPADDVKPEAQASTEELPATGSERSAVLSAAGFKADDPKEVAHALAAGLDQPETLADAQDPPQSAEPDALPIYLKPLAWINSPLEHFPRARNTLGTAGIVTLANALAVLIYVIFFRAH